MTACASSLYAEQGCSAASGTYGSVTMTNTCPTNGLTSGLRTCTVTFSPAQAASALSVQVINVDKNLDFFM